MMLLFQKIILSQYNKINDLRLMRTSDDLQLIWNNNCHYVCKEHAVCNGIERTVAWLVQHPFLGGLDVRVSPHPSPGVMVVHQARGSDAKCLKTLLHRPEEQNMYTVEPPIKYTPNKGHNNKL